MPSTTRDFDDVVPLDAVDRHALGRVGGKGANLGELTRAGFPVPSGFCVTTSAFGKFLRGVDDREDLFAQLDALAPDDAAARSTLGATIRARLTSAPIPQEVATAVRAAHVRLGEAAPCAVRSSATAEDLPSASFAGQQDTYLNVVGGDALLERVRACWASLFTDRAIAYRARHGFDHRKVLLAVVVQRMVLPEVSGIAFTADPVDGRRHIVSIDAGFGLGEALVSGVVSADLYKVDKRTHTIVERRIADKRLAILPEPGGGTREVQLPDDRRRAAVLRDEVTLDLARMATRIEAHYGAPQDIEWCVADGTIFIVQSRPVTTLYPLPTRGEGDEADATGRRASAAPYRVYASFSHVQVMTDPIAAFGQSVLRRLPPFGRDAEGESRYVLTAGGRLYVDLTDLLRVEPLRQRIPRFLRFADALMADSLADVVERPRFRNEASDTGMTFADVVAFAAPIVGRAAYRAFIASPEAMTRAMTKRMTGLLERYRAQLAEAGEPTPRLRRALCILVEAFEDAMFSFLPSVLAGGLSRVLLEKRMAGRGLDDELDALSRGMEGNVTTEMDLALGDIADLARKAPLAAAHLRTAVPKTALTTVRAVPGGPPIADAAARFLDRYGMRANSEIDATRPRWREDPSPLVQVIVGNLATDLEAGAHRAHHDALKARAREAAARIVAAVPAIERPLIRRLVRASRAYTALREHPKFYLVHLIDFARSAALDVGADLAASGRLDEASDVWHFTGSELLELAGGGLPEARSIAAARKERFESYRRMTPPRVMTSEGEVVVGHHHHDGLPQNALGGTGASAGIVEGRAKVILDPTRAILEPGEILVAPFTDPGWTPLFLSAAGLVMEVGGMMTHGSVVAREYGIPAVVCVPGATEKIRSGQRVRVDGGRGVVELLDG